METIQIQRQLNIKGYGPLIEDGINGAKTVDAIKKFQSDAGLLVDGVVGQKTISALFHQESEIRKVSKQGIEFIIGEEGIRLKPYLDSVGIPTIGVGCTYYEDGNRVKITDKPITRDRAISLFSNLLKIYELAVYSSTRDDINQNQFNALVSLCFNIGVNAFKKSTLLKLVNKNPSDPNIRQAFLAWRNAGGKPILLKRRERESNLYFGSID